jgi:prepilin-type processing-associated H-X9-DG protein
VNNLKQIGLAVHNFLSANNRLPADIRDAEGKPLLSWRVEILPFLEQQALWEQIHKDEPWDSPHNKALLEIMPGTFAIPGTPAPEAGHTFYRGFSGPHTGFEQRRGQPVNIADFTDGTSNTIVVVEANEAVPWLKPDSDLEFDGDAPPNEGKDPRPLMGGHFGRGFNALFMDGSVRFLSESIAPSILRALITRDGGEVISQDQLN